MTRSSGPSVPGGARRRALIVVGSSGKFDARAHRIASTLARRGHEVIVVGRAAPGLPREEVLGDGTRVIRVPVSAPDGLPLPAFVRRPIARAWARRRRGESVASTPVVSASASATPVPRARGWLGAVSLASAMLRRGMAGLVRIAAVVLSVRAQVRAARARVRSLGGPPPDVVLGLGFMGLPVALGVADAIASSGAGRDGGTSASARGAPQIVYDASDIYVDAGNIARLPRPIRAAFGRLERRWARRAALVTTANDGYADVLARRFTIDRPLVLLNCPPFVEPRRGEHPLRAALGSDGDRPLVLYHGGISPDRGIEQLIDATSLLGDLRPPVLVVVMGYGALEATLRARIAAEGLGDRVRLLPPVPQDVLVAWIADADVAAMPIQPTTLNHRLTVPNKLFEAMAAGVPVLASDLPGMAPIVRSTGCGVLVDPTSAFAVADGIRRILEAPAETREGWRDAGRRAARERYSWEREAPRLLEALAAITGGAW